MGTEQYDVLSTPTPQLDDGAIRRLLADAWGVEASVLGSLPSERDLNVQVDDRFVLKVTNPAEAPELVDLENVSMAHVVRTAPDLPVPRLVDSDSGPTTTVVDASGRTCRARLITVVPGTCAEGLLISTALAEDIGSLTARTSIALQGLFHPAADRVIDWDVRRAPAVLGAPGTLALLGEEGELLADLLPRVTAATEATRQLPSGLQHADITLTNVLADGDTVTGLIDFGDMHHTAAVCDLAVTLTAVIRNTAEVQLHPLWELAAAVLNGYQRHRLLSPAEVAVLAELVVARLGLTLAIAARRTPEDADHAAYINQHDERSRAVLREWCEPGLDAVRDRLHRLCGTRGVATTDASSLRERRRAAMGGDLGPLFYRRPLEIVRGQGPWLFAADGTRYLDAYNNVAVIGHAHPAVTQAVSRQLATVNTHNRYLHPGIIELAERLLATMPPELDTCLFTTSGTEANDLAWRMATAQYRRSSGAGGRRARTTALAVTDLSPMEWLEDTGRGTSRHLSGAAGQHRRHGPRDGVRPGSPRPISDWPSRASGPRWCWPTSGSPARVSSTCPPSSSPASWTARTRRTRCSWPTRSRRASAAPARRCGASPRPAWSRLHHPRQADGQRLPHRCRDHATRDRGQPGPRPRILLHLRGHSRGRGRRLRRTRRPGDLPDPRAGRGGR